jgi:protein required for attachment to host cells
MDATWIISANASRARIFSQARPGQPLEEIDDMINTPARMRAHDLETDDLGLRAAAKSRHNVGAPRTPSNYEPDVSPAEHETQRFARSIGDFLHKAHLDGRYRDLCVVASPEFLGMLRSELRHQHLDSTVKSEINKDYTHCSPDELRQRIQAHASE